jgi:hypothetical protein
MRISWRKTIVVASVSGLLLFGATSATGHDIVKNDPNDVDTLDIKRVIYRHGDGRTTLKLEFHDKLQQSQFTDPNSPEWVLFTKGDSKVDFVVEYEYRVKQDSYSCKITDFNGDLVRRIPVTKRAFSVKCRFLNTRIGGLAEKFAAAAYDQGGMDFAPNTGPYRHD